MDYQEQKTVERYNLGDNGLSKLYHCRNYGYIAIILLICSINDRINISDYKKRRVVTVTNGFLHLTHMLYQFMKILFINFWFIYAFQLLIDSSSAFSVKAICIFIRYKIFFWRASQCNFASNIFCANPKFATQAPSPLLSDRSPQLYIARR